jgi:uncharacterized membrane protein YcaP (DUF421 family)
MPDIVQLFAGHDIPFLEKILRTLVVYAFLLVGLRLGGKRELGMLNPFDLVVLLVLSNTLQNAIIGPDNSLLGGLFGAAVLLTVNYLVVRFLFVHPKLDRYVEGEALVLVRDGKVIQQNMTKELITQTELESRARIQGVDDLSHVACARIEVGGALTFVLKHPTTLEDHQKAVRDRLARIEATLNALSARLGA